MNKLHGTLLPLHCACMVGDADIAELLISKGARVRRSIQVNSSNENVFIR